MLVTLPKLLVRYAVPDQLGGGYKNVVIDESVKIPVDPLSMQDDAFVVPKVITSDLPTGTVILGPDGVPQVLPVPFAVEFPHRFTAVILPGTVCKKSAGNECIMLRTKKTQYVTIQTRLITVLEKLMRYVAATEEEYQGDVMYAISEFIGERGKVNVMRLACEIGFELDIDMICNKAALKGQLACLQYAQEIGIDLTEKMAHQAIIEGNVTCLEYIHKSGVVLDESACALAAKHGRLECLTYLHMNSVSWDATTCHSAAARGNIECLIYAHKNGCPWDKRTCAEAAEKNHLNCLQYAHENGCPWSTKVCREAAENGHLLCLRYAHENGCEWDESACYMALLFQRYDCLDYLIENKCELSPIGYYYAVLSGSVDCLRYLKSHDSKIKTESNKQTWRKTHNALWNTQVCNFAAAHGYIDCLRYLHENGCPWGADSCAAAREKSHLECVQYLHENGCPCDCEKT